MTAVADVRKGQRDMPYQEAFIEGFSMNHALLWMKVVPTCGIAFFHKGIPQGIIYFLFFYLNIFIQDIKHNSARLSYVVLLYNKTIWVHKNTLSYTFF